MYKVGDKVIVKIKEATFTDTIRSIQMFASDYRNPAWYLYFMQNHDGGFDEESIIRLANEGNDILKELVWD